MSCVFRSRFLLLIMSLVLIGAPNAMATDQGDGQAEDKIEGQVLEILTPYDQPPAGGHLYGLQIRIQARVAGG